MNLKMQTLLSKSVRFMSPYKTVTEPAKLPVIRQEGVGFIPTNSLTESALSIYLTA